LLGEDGKGGGKKGKKIKRKGENLLIEKRLLKGGFHKNGAGKRTKPHPGGG